MSERKRLIELIRHIVIPYWAELVADHLIANDVAIVVHGRWIMDKLEIGNPYDGNSTMIADIGNCSVCGYRCEMLPIMNYCPNCGAHMDLEVE